MKKRLLDLFDAAALYIIYLFSSLLGYVLVLLFDVIWTVLQFRGSRMLLDGELLSEHLTELLDAQTVLMILVSNLVVVLLYWLAFCFRRETLRHYAGFFAPRFWSVVGAVASGVVLHALISGAIALLDIPADMMQQYEHSMTELFDDSLFPVLLAVLISAPIVEEIVFRGALLRALQKALNTPLAILISSVLFAVAHMHPIQIAYAFVMGVVLCLIRLKSGSLWSAMAMHVAFNAANYLPVLDMWTADAVSMAVLAVVFAGAFGLACIEKKHCQC